MKTFTHQELFIETLEELETAFIGAYLAAVKEFAEQGQPGLAQIAAQIAASRPSTVRSVGISAA